MFKLILCLILSYFLGSLPSGLIISKIWFGVDIRNYGSGNIGATNVWRSLGLAPGIIVLVADAAKGLLPVLWAKNFLSVPTLPHGLSEILVCIIVLVGHNYSIFLNFKGGKGVATSLGVFIALDWRMALTGVGIFTLIVYLTRYISLGSILGMSSAPLAVILMYRKDPRLYTYLFFTLITVILVIYSHRSNIKRLLAGSEHKVGEKVDISSKNPKEEVGS